MNAASATSRIHRLMAHMGPAVPLQLARRHGSSLCTGRATDGCSAAVRAGAGGSDRGEGATSLGADGVTAAGRALVLVDLANVPQWFHALQLADPLRARRFLGRTSAAVLAVCEPRAWSRRHAIVRLPWVVAARRHGRLALLPVDGGDECGDFAICTAAAFASALGEYSRCVVVTDDLQLSQRLRALHGDAFLSVVQPCGTLAARDTARGGHGMRRQDEWHAEAALLQPAAARLLLDLRERGTV